jgi:hexosaminidase
MKKISVMKKVILGQMFLFLALATVIAQADELSLIPQPQKVERQDGFFVLQPHTVIFADKESRATARFLTGPLHQATGYAFKVKSVPTLDEAVNGIELTTAYADTNLGPEGYELTVATNLVIIRAPTQTGLFYGIQTLLQLLPPEIFSSKVVSEVTWQVPALKITDWPRFAWRGLMLDVCRHFYDKTEVEKLLAAMARYKLNTFHWHLTDDQGWRIQIDKYPKLTEVGAWRSGIGFDLASNASTAYDENGRYGGFYTKKDIREVVAFAAARHITIVPEIEMPGHALAALTAYPQYGCAGITFSVPTKGGVNDGVYSPANEGTFLFLENVLSEVFEMFPSKYVHIGGDEVPKGPWQHDAECQALMKREGLKNEDELESWFIRRIERYVNTNGKTLIGWSEITRGGLAANAVVMDWIGGGQEAASAGHNVVMTPTSYCYLDYYQSADHSTEPRAIGGLLPLEKIYSFDPIPKNLPPQYDSYILGGQANLWTEYIGAKSHAEYMIFPRECALAEVTWSARDGRSYDDFVRRLQTDYRRLDELGINYRRTSPEMK